MHWTSAESEQYSRSVLCEAETRSAAHRGNRVNYAVRTVSGVVGWSLVTYAGSSGITDVTASIMRHVCVPDLIELVVDYLGAVVS